jgi:phosphoenolpyruvate-protein kinase (PTS system EI component)
MTNTKEGAFVFCGLGLDTVSCSPSVIPQIKKFFSEIDVSYAKKELKRLLYLNNGEELLNSLMNIIY